MIWGFIYAVSHRLPPNSSNLADNIKLKKNIEAALNLGMIKFPQIMGEPVQML